MFQVVNSIIKKGRNIMVTDSMEMTLLQQFWSIYQAAEFCGISRATSEPPGVVGIVPT